jgi:protein-S-isoprenylcysteine O-methyltransferase Ste14
MSTWKHVRAILLLPVMVTVVVPGVIVYLSGVDTFGVWEAVPFTRWLLPVLGFGFILLGVVLLVATIRLFARIGKGTLAPWNPTERLVVQGVYRHVRTPMISGVAFVLLGEALATASLPLFCWFAAFAMANAVYIPLSEELGLVKRFGDEYEEYKRNEPRWIPRVKG